MASNVERIEETLSAALDGEPVDLAELRAALGTATGRDALAAFVLLRSAAVADGAWPCAKTASQVIDRFQADRERRAHPVANHRLPAVLAASLAAIAVAGSFWLGTTVAPGRVTVRLTAPPPPAVHTNTMPVVESVPAAFSGIAPCRASEPQPPKLTRVLRYVRGVDWSDGT
jgi:hypothetical protein